MKEELLYRIALTQVPGIGPVQTRTLIDYFGGAASIFNARKKEIAGLPGIGEQRSAAIKQWNDFSTAEEELRFIEANHIQPLFITDKCYPQRLLNCYDAPILLYYRGNANLNAARVINIIGTRSNSEYGREVTEELLTALQPMQPLIVSGLAFGIDAIAHKTALKLQLPTVAVLAHGHKNIYPCQHKGLAGAMLQRGGLLTEFGKESKPDRHNFPRRNRIVAGMCDATVVIETATKGGSMITAELAFQYNRDVFAVPGRLNDIRSEGCLQLISSNKAVLLRTGQQLAELLGWNKCRPKPPVQQKIFIPLSTEEHAIMNVFEQEGTAAIDEICIRSGLSSSTVAAAMLNLELQHQVCSLPGKRYRLAHAT
ncbi:DNA-processing protein DprA [Sediminibacterium ginsengisoli]|uniref:DNA processing protein n=1 Tax=Sediminibacterium ginsengisoli TaxID=413434 RepID=A0A1T4K7K6_9BACT|nr:DNA-processing protein DprA [Sediminibacterium ginsengisoli]SJZ38430.1 DNA processing protein [Sediminibacterium ginsengisoli]